MWPSIPSGNVASIFHALPINASIAKKTMIMGKISVLITK